MDGKETYNEVNDLSGPQVIEHFVGQEKVKQLVKVALEACWMDGSRFPDTLALGGPGLGKTQMSNLIALENGANCKEALANSFSNISELHSFLIDCKDGDVLFLDELHTLKKDLMVVLYRAMENRKIFIRRNGRNNPLRISLSNFTIIGATTDHHLLPKPMIDRFKLNLHFEFYTDEEIEIILRNRCKKLQWQCDEAVFSQISCRSRGIPRIALRILENARRVCRSEGSDCVNVEHIQTCCFLEDLDCIGLNGQERKLLKILAAHNAPVRLNTLAMCMGTLSRNISQTLEPYLFRSELITKTDKGRVITEKGLQHLKSNREN